MFTEGEVTNVSSRPLEDVSVVVVYRTGSGEFITSDTALVEYNPIRVGETTPFKVITSEKVGVGSCEVAFKYLLGGTIPTRVLPTPSPTPTSTPDPHVGAYRDLRDELVDAVTTLVARRGELRFPPRPVDVAWVEEIRSIQSDLELLLNRWNDVSVPPGYEVAHLWLAIVVADELTVSRIKESWADETVQGQTLINRVHKVDEEKERLESIYARAELELTVARTGVPPGLPLHVLSVEAHVDSGTTNWLDYRWTLVVQNVSHDVREQDVEILFVDLDGFIIYARLVPRVRLEARTDTTVTGQFLVDLPGGRDAKIVALFVNG